MKLPTKIVFSASRRTDIPAFYMKWFMGGIETGSFRVINPYNRRETIVPATPERVHSIVFWSKNFGPFIEGGYGEALIKAGYHLLFNFTVNSESPLLEPHVPPLSERLRQLEYLCRNFNRESINWRFDPICSYRTDGSEIQDNRRDFARIAAKASECGIRRCITSFMDDYAKIRKRVASMPDFSFVDPSLEKKVAIVLEMERQLAKRNILLRTCCEKELLEALPPSSRVTRSSCIPNDLLVKLYGGKLSLRRDSGQRIKDGCGCMLSVDIGSYHLHPCGHRCLFCYANPAAGRPP